MSLETLIEEGRTIQKGLTYVEPGYNVIRMYDVYKLRDSNQYFNWKECVIRFLQMYSKNDVDRFICYAKEFEKNLHYLPAFISNMVGVLEACKALPSREIEQLNQNNALEGEIEALQNLEWDYLSFVHSADDEVNSYEAIETFHKWHAAASVLFDKCFYTTDEDYQKFQDIASGANGYGLKSEYDRIYTPYQKLLNRVKEGRNVKSVAVRRNNSETSNHCKNGKLNIFISYSHADKKWFDRLETHLKALRGIYPMLSIGMIQC